MFKFSCVFLILCCACQTFAQSDYFEIYRQNIAGLSDREKVDSIAALPFEIMNSQTAESSQLYSEGLEIAQRIKDNNRIALCYEKLALVTYYMGDYKLSVTHNLKAIKYFEKTNNTEKIGAVYATLGHQMKRRNLQKAFEYMRKGIRILEQEKNPIPLSAAYNNFGVLFEMRNDVDSALYFYFKGLKIVKSANDSLGIPYSLNNISQAYILNNEFEKAKPYLDESIRIRELRDDQNGLAENYGLYGEYYFKQQRYDKANEYYLRSLAIAEQIQYTWLAQVISEQIGKTYELQGDFKNALKYSQKSQSFKDQLLNEQTNKTIAQLEIQFDTEKKEKEIAQQNERISKHQAEVEQRNAFVIGLSIALILLIIVGVLIYRQQQFKQARLKAENVLKDQISEEKTKNKIHEERLRISRDLHDNIGSQLTFITSSMDNMKFMTKEEKVSHKLTDLTAFTRTTIGQLRDTIWAMNKGNITVVDLQGRILNYIEDAKKSTDSIAFELEQEILENTIVFTATQGVNLFRIVQEAINNAVKYALPSIIKIRFIAHANSIEIDIIDDGIGFKASEIVYGNGLRNMEDRAKDIGATFKIISEEASGTKIHIKLTKDKLNDV